MIHPVRLFPGRDLGRSPYWAEGTPSEWTCPAWKTLRDGHHIGFGVVRTSGGQGVVYDDDGHLVMHLLTNLRKVRVFGVALPETLRVAAIGRPMSQMIDHPLFRGGTTGGDAIVKKVRTRSGDPQAKGSLSSMELVLGSTTFETRTTVLDPQHPHVPFQFWNRSGPTLPPAS